MLLNFPREIGLRRRQCDSRKVFDDYVKRINGKASIYTSLYSFERKHPTRAWKYDTDSVVIDRAWWDFDTTEEHDIITVKDDVNTLLSKIEGDIRVVATGRGFHVHQIFEKPVKGTAIAKHVDRYERKVGRGLKTLDGVGNPLKLTRVPDTYNVTRKKWAVNIDVKEFMYNHQEYVIPKKPDSSLLKNDPFRGENRHSSFNIVKWIAENPPVQMPILQAFDGEIGSMSQVPIPPCLDKAMRVENPKHDVRLALTQHLAESLRWFSPPSTLNYDEKKKIGDEIAEFYSTLGWRDYNQQTTRFHINSILDYENTPSCSWLQARNLCTGPCWRDDGTRRN